MKKFLSALHWFNIFLVQVAKLALLAMVVIITMVVFLRILGRGLAWGEEIPMLLVVWFTMISMAIGVKLNLHISMDVLPAKLPPGFDKFLRKFADIVIIGVAAVMIYYGTKLAWGARRAVLPGCGLGTYWQYVPIPLSGVMILLDAVLNLFGIDKQDEKFAAQSERLWVKKEEVKQ